MPKNSPTRLPGSGVLPDEVTLGYVSGIFGIRGEVRLHIHNRESDLLRGQAEVVLVSKSGDRRLVSLRARPGAGRRVIGRIEGVDTREDAEGWTGWQIVVPRASLPDLEEDEFYLCDVEGASVIVDDTEFGIVATVHSTPGGEVLEIRAGKDTVFVPMLHQHIAEMDTKNRRIVLHPEALVDA